MKKSLLGVLVAGALSCASFANASLIDVSATLTGDPRPSNPDGLNVGVHVVSDTTSNTATFTVDLNMAATHPNAFLGAFGFNLEVGAGESFAITAITNPAGWSIASDVESNAKLVGSGNMSFLLTLDDPPGSANNVTNNDATNLIFTLTKTGGFFTESDFLSAPVSCSSDAGLGCGQMGAHLQSLTAPAGSGLTDSGVALGNWPGVDPRIPPSAIPEPGMLALTSLGLLGLAFARRRG